MGKTGTTYLMDENSRGTLSVFINKKICPIYIQTEFGAMCNFV